VCLFFYIFEGQIIINNRLIIKIPYIMKTQEVETGLDFEKTILITKPKPKTKTKPKRLTIKFKEWFWDFLESSE
jgi:hypothetical protein